MASPSSRRTERAATAFLFCVSIASIASLASIGCGGRNLKTRDVPTDVDAGPSGIAVDPLPTLPPPSDFAHGTDGVATLRAPLPPDVVADLVRRWFEAFHARSADALEDDVDAVVVYLFADHADAPRGQFLAELATRMKSAPFDQVEIDQMYTPQDVEVYGREELDQPGRPSRPAGMSVDDVLVRVPILTPRIGADYLFGDEVLLLLRRDGTRYRVHAYGEKVPK